MMQHPSSPPMAEAILRAMKRSGTYSIQLIARKIGAPAHANEEIPQAMQWLIREGQVEACAPFMGSVSYRRRDPEPETNRTAVAPGTGDRDLQVEPDEASLTEYAHSLRRQAALAAAGRRGR